MTLQRTLIFSCTIAVFVFCAGCNDKQEIKVYRTSKAQQESPGPDATGMDMPGGMPASGGVAQPGGMPDQAASAITSTPPSQWEPQPPTSMRLASFLVKGENGTTADISLVMLGGAAGGVLENVNRWLSQLGQPAITADKLTQIAQHVSSPFGDVTVVDLEGLPTGGDATKDGRIIGGIVSGSGGTLFFKMRGNATLAEVQKTNFIQWIGTVKMSDAGGGGAAAEGAAVPPVPMAPTVDTTKPQAKWEVPDGWKSVPATSMRYASFAVAGENGEAADVSVVFLPGEGGGDLQNVNRWRGQIGLEPVEEADLKTLVAPVTGKSGEILTADMSGPKARILSGWTKHGGGVWYFKLSGPETLAGGEKEKFVKFLQSVEFQP